MPVITQDSNHIITEPGAYWLEQDVAWMDGGYGLQINASNVTVNLNGHFLGNNGPAAVYAYGQHDVTVANGHIWGGSAYGVRIEGYTQNNRASGLDVYGQTVVGISLESWGNGFIDYNHVHDIYAADRALGIIAGGNCTVVGGNTVDALHGGREAVFGSDGGNPGGTYNTQWFNNHFSSDNSQGDLYFLWLYGQSDDSFSNVFDSVYGQQTSSEGFISLGIFSPSTATTSNENIVLNILEEDFYQLPGDFHQQCHDHFFWE